MKIKHGFELSQEEAGIYVARAVGDLKKEFPDAVQMGLSGAFLWDQMTEKDMSRAELIFALDNFYECATDSNQIAADVDMFTGFLRENGFLEEE